jgi:hypothetical protein
VEVPGASDCNTGSRIYRTYSTSMILISKQEFIDRAVELGQQMDIFSPEELIQCAENAREDVYDEHPIVLHYGVINFVASFLINGCAESHDLAIDSNNRLRTRKRIFNLIREETGWGGKTPLEGPLKLSDHARVKIKQIEDSVRRLADR